MTQEESLKIVEKVINVLYHKFEVEKIEAKIDGLYLAYDYPDSIMYRIEELEQKLKKLKDEQI